MSKVKTKISLFENIEKGNPTTTLGVEPNKDKNNLWLLTVKDLWKDYKDKMNYKDFLKSMELKEEYYKRKSIMKN